MDGFFPIFFLMVVLKIPIAMLLYLVWWAFHAETLPDEAPPESEDGHRFGRFRRQPKRPRGPRRGDHGPGTLPLPECPPAGRTRVIGTPAPARAAAGHARRDAGA